MNDPLYMLLGITPFLAVLCYYDCRFRRLPNYLTLTLALAALAWRLGEGGMPFFMNGLAGGIVCGLFLLLPYFMHGAGGGDVKMLFAAGCALGLGRCAILLMLMSLAGVVLAVFMLIFNKVNAQRLKHYFRVLFDYRYDRIEGRKNLPDKNDEKSRIPFGVAIAAGCWLTLILEIAAINGR